MLTCNTKVVDMVNIIAYLLNRYVSIVIVSMLVY